MGMFDVAVFARAWTGGRRSLNGDVPWRLWTTLARRMNNLLRTLTESNVRPHADLRLLLNTVKEGRKQSVENKLSDPFYDALDGVLADLKTVTLDNRDAEAFLKPVSKAEVPDYYEVISNPMDFQTMQKKVKLKNYKSKREFKDDLELIWSNCYTYNASENHPLRQCVKRLKGKADRLLKHVTDRRERTDPQIPLELGAGYLPKVNGTSRTHTRSPSYSSMKGSTPGLAIVKSSSSTSLSRHSSSPMLFKESSAIIRTPEGMNTFYELDKEVVMALKKPNQSVVQKLKDLVSLDTEGPEDVDMEDLTTESDGILGDKRKLSASSESRPRKRARFMSAYPTPLPDDDARDELSELWWAAAQSDTLLANGVPPIPFGPASSEQKRSRLPSLPSTSSSSSLSSLSTFFPFHSSSRSSVWRPPPPPSIPKSKSPRPKPRRKASIEEPDEIPPTHIENSNALLNLMNTNIKSMRRIRHTHSKFSALNATTLVNEDVEESGGGGGIGAMPGAGPSGASGFGGDSLGGAGENSMVASADDEILNEKVDETPWVMMARSKGKRGKGREKIARVGGVEIGGKNAWGCMQWANKKILEHVGFQGTSQVSLDVMSGVMSEYISNVGRTIKYLCDQRPATMTPEEIVLHTLFESGTSKVQDLERYIRDDVERYSSRLNELEKKIVGAYRDTTAGETLEDEGLFEDEEEEETGALAIGDFADMLGEDYLGLRELGIAQEYGMSSLSVPKKLLRSKKNQHKPAAAKPNEPPPPYPPPPPFIPLTSSKLDDQIGLLKPYYQSRFASLAASVVAPPPPPPLPGPSLPGPTLPGPVIGAPPALPGPSIPQPSIPASSSVTSASLIGLPSSNSILVPGSSTITTASTSDVSQLPQSQSQQLQQPQSIDLASLPPLTLVEDLPTAVQVKMGPLGQITKGGGTGGGKKKSKGSGGGGSAAGTGSGQGGATGGATASSGSAGIGGVPGTAGSGLATATSPAIPSMAIASTTNADSNASPKKKKGGTPGIGTGNGRKKKGPEGSQQNGTSGGNGQGGGGGGGGSSQPYPPVVVASA
ncbi:hypothetical protein Agabi119p4_2705 [Agaricus bisporus var. burnettii]|uniref:Bromo domain-containing protein n=1 Tax=Agaricus bisporus var. burnettii TaxID=192524 RepID=A0A8H7KK87_AGABI|nr:hypothetical protein Agabi119p4_2705 [Agaricus bisporus var. burnettii]